MPSKALQLPEYELARLRRAALFLEDDNIAVRLADVVGGPIDAAVKVIPPGIQKRIDALAQAALLQAFGWALDSLRGQTCKGKGWATLAGATSTGGLAGIFGAAALPIELPLSTFLFLRGIAEVARGLDVDLADPRHKLECLFVLALGSRPKDYESAYWPIREHVGRTMTEAAQGLSQRGAVSYTAPALIALASRIAGRFGIMVSERVAARSVPLLGAAVGATVNFLFLTHYKRMAFGHFTVLSMEPIYGKEHVKAAYEKILEERPLLVRREATPKSRLLPSNG